MSRWLSRVLLVVVVASVSVTAAAAEVVRGEVGVVGGGWFTEEPTAPVFGLTSGVRVGGALSVRASVGVLPDFNRRGLVSLLGRPFPSGVPPERFSGDVMVRFAPVLLDVVGWNGRIHVGVGAGVVRTSDDLRFLQVEDDPDHVAVARQWHPTASWTVGVEGPLTRHLAVSSGLVSRNYVETIGVGTHLRSPVSLTVSVMWRPYREKRPLHD